MKQVAIILSVLAMTMIGCGKKQTTTANYTQEIQDTIVVKQKNILNRHEVNFISKSYSYYWLAGKDTLDFVIRVNERKRDNTLHLRIFHRKPMLFADALDKVAVCLPLIKEDFDLSKLASFFFEAPIYYLDLATKLSNEYEQKFGRQNVDFSKFHEFLLESSLTSQLNHFFSPLNKRVKRYGFEKFHLIEKQHYNEYLPNVDFTEYPEFTFNAHVGVDVQLENK